MNRFTPYARALHEAMLSRLAHFGVNSFWWGLRSSLTSFSPSTSFGRRIPILCQCLLQLAQPVSTSIEILLGIQLYASDRVLAERKSVNLGRNANPRHGQSILNSGGPIIIAVDDFGCHGTST